MINKDKKRDSDSHWRPSNPDFEPGKHDKRDDELSNNKDNKDKRNDIFNDNYRPSDPRTGGPRRRWFSLILMLIFMSLMGYLLFFNTAPSQEVSYTEFKDMLRVGKINKVDIIGSSVIEFICLESLPVKQTNGDLLYQNVDVRYKTRIPYVDLDILEELSVYGVDIKGSEQSLVWYNVLLQLFPWILFIGFMIYIMKNAANGQLMQYGRSHARQFDEKNIKIKFNDVAGQKEAKYELVEVVDFLKNPKEYNEIGAKIPHGILMVGPPGTGKTLLAKAVAGEAGVPFFHTSGSDFVEMFVGMGAARVRDLFAQGKKSAPCIIFIDEIDAVGRSRGSGLGGGHDEREQTLNQILVEMDGFDTNSGVIVMAATNRADVLDPALLRAGRFDRTVNISLPDVNERAEILKIHSAKIKMDANIDLKKIARATPGASGADLANMVNEAALYAARAKRKAVNIKDFEDARDKMVLGVAKKSHVMTPEDKMLTAYHEAGHALLYYYLPDLDPLYKVTIIPHGDAGGVTMGLPENDKNYLKQSYLYSYIKLSMGGYIAEKLIIGQTTTGPSADIKQATNVARRMVTEWGMSELGFIDLGENNNQPIFLGREITQHKDFSDQTALKIDNEVNKILKFCMSEAEGIIRLHREQLDTIAEALMERETLDDNDIRQLLGLEIVEHKNSDFK